jgi:hypothetical protein
MPAGKKPMNRITPTLVKKASTPKVSKKTTSTSSKKIEGNEIAEEHIANCWCGHVLKQKQSAKGFFYLSCKDRMYNTVSKTYEGGCGAWYKSDDVLQDILSKCGECECYKKTEDPACKNCVRIQWNEDPEVKKYKAFARACYCDRDLAVWQTKNVEPAYFYYKCPIQTKDGDNWKTGCTFWCKCDDYESLEGCEQCGTLKTGIHCQKCPS